MAVRAEAQLTLDIQAPTTLGTGHPCQVSAAAMYKGIFSGIKPIIEHRKKEN